MEPLLRDFASRAIDFADIEGRSKNRSSGGDDLRRESGRACELEATERDVISTFHGSSAIIDAAAIEFSVLERGTPLGDEDDLESSGHAVPEQIRPAKGLRSALVGPERPRRIGAAPSSPPTPREHFDSGIRRPKTRPRGRRGRPCEDHAVGHHQRLSNPRLSTGRRTRSRPTDLRVLRTFLSEP